MLPTKQGKFLNEYVKDYVIFDLETTGLDPVSDEIIEIAAVKVIGEEVVDEFSTLVNPGIHINEEVTKINGIDDDMVKDAPDIKAALTQFIDFIEDMTLVGHNIHRFDLKFIYPDCEKHFGKTPDNDYIDTVIIARGCFPEMEHHSLTYLANYYGITTKGAHRALADCRMNQQVYFHLGQEMEPEKLKAKGIKICPRCGFFLTKRSGRFGEFYGCSRYPDCNYTENIKHGY